MVFPSPTILDSEKWNKHVRTVIFLHGRGSNGGDFAKELSEEISSSGKNIKEHFEASKSNIKWIFPTAPARLSTFWKEEQNEWFDIWSLSDTAARQDLQIQGLCESIRHIRDLIHNEINTYGIPPSNIYIGGISQGFATAFHVLLSQPYRLGGFFGLSGWCPFKQGLESICESNALPKDLQQFYAVELSTIAETTNKTIETPVFMAHCEDDGVVEFRHGEEARDLSLKLGFKTQSRQYQEGDHWINEPQGVDDIIEFIDQSIKQEKTSVLP